MDPKVDHIVELQPGYTLVIHLAGTTADVTLSVPLGGAPWVDIVSPKDKMVRHYEFASRLVEVEQ